MLEYSLRNLTADTLKPLYAGLFADWDLPGDSGRNTARYDSVQHLGYVYDPLAARLYAGVQVLGARSVGVYSIDNNAAAGTPIYLRDGFSPAEKYLALRDGFGRAHRSVGTATAGVDASQVMSTLVPRLAPRDSVQLAFAVLVAPTLAELQAAAQAARNLYQTYLAAASQPTEWQLFPNPAREAVQVQLPGSFGAATVQVFSAQGQLVAQAELPTGGGALSLATLRPGFYLVRATGAAGSLWQRLVRE